MHNTETAQALLERLVSFDTTSRYSNRQLIEFVRDHLAGHGIDCDLVWNAEGNKASLWATIGPKDVPGTILSGHTDVVPVDGQNWTSDPFTLRAEGGKLYGRGSADMKGFLAIALALVPEMVEKSLRKPIHLAFSYDEEVGCAGIVHLVEWMKGLPVRPHQCVIGEPTEMRPIIGHKGGRGYSVRFTGLEAHSSLAPKAVNAIEYAAEFVMFLKGVAREMQEAANDDQYDIAHSTLQVGLIQGGTAVNIVPKECDVTFEFRHLLGVDPDAIAKKIEDYIGGEILSRMRERHPGADIAMEKIYAYPALDTQADHPTVRLVKSLVGRNDDGKVAFGTEAGFFSQRLGIPTVVCGPGSITQAHKPDEYVTTEQIARCQAFLSRLIDWSTQ